THVVNGNPIDEYSRLSCKINFKRPNSDICHVRLDFVRFSMTGPSDLGECDGGSLTVTAENLHDFITCGNNTGQHLYLEYGDCDIVSVSMNPNQDGNPPPTFDLQATFINCEQSGSSKTIQNDPPPAGCDQYYTNPSGQVRSFNYISQKFFGISQWNDVQGQINNQKYTVCVKTLSGYRRIIWGPCQGEEVPFSLSGYGSSVSTQGDLSSYEMKTGSDCQTDWIDIPGSPAGRYCGSIFPGTIASSARPFQMFVSFNDEEIVAINNMINPATGCPIGFDCVDPYDPIRPAQGSPTNSASGFVPCHELGEFCALNPGLEEFVDSGNTGFCLQYVLTN
ncbi:unnamed protein product, partial [Allacma fusca]